MREPTLSDWEAMPSATAVVEWPWKLVVADSDLEGRHSDRRELYQLVDDPGETVNRADDEPEIVARLSAEIARHREEHPPVGATPGVAELGEQMQQALRALGYL
jgi:hypothetical protein